MLFYVIFYPSLRRILRKMSESLTFDRNQRSRYTFYLDFSESSRGKREDRPDSLLVSNLQLLDLIEVKLDVN